MNANNLPRRQFLMAGALITAGGLMLPRSAHAEGPTTLAVPDANADVVAQLRAVLDRPNLDWFGESVPREYNCQCARCRALRRQVFECAECGYVGPWLVSWCECRDIRASNIAYARRGIAAIKAGETPKPGDFTPGMLRRMLRE